MAVSAVHWHRTSLGHSRARGHPRLLAGPSTTTRAGISRSAVSIAQTLSVMPLRQSDRTPLSVKPRQFSRPRFERSSLSSFDEDKNPQGCRLDRRRRTITRARLCARQLEGLQEAAFAAAVRRVACATKRHRQSARRGQTVCVHEPSVCRRQFATDVRADRTSPANLHRRAPMELQRAPSTKEVARVTHTLRKRITIALLFLHLGQAPSTERRRPYNPRLSVLCYSSSFDKYQDSNRSGLDSA